MTKKIKDESATENEISERGITVPQQQLKDQWVEDALISGERAELLCDLFGADTYAELRRLAQRATMSTTRGGNTVLILPGIMGSSLASPASGEVWLNLWKIPFGIIEKLTLNNKGDPTIRAEGVLESYYIKLKLRLKELGHNAVFFPYDWRQSLDTLGKTLADRVAAEVEAGRGVDLVCHSMGGLVARAALKHQPKGLGRIITLGTPHKGSFSPIQAFRGAHSLINKIAMLDQCHSAEDLARDIFSTFPGLIEMMPAAAGMLDYFNLQNWPAAGVRPPQDRLSVAKQVQSSLPVPADGTEMILVVGINKETVVKATNLDNKEFVYTTSMDGDGTVPLECAVLPGKLTYYIEDEHGSLPNNGLVAEAVNELLRSGKTNRLPSERPTTRAAAQEGREIKESTLIMPIPVRDRGRPLSVQEQREFLSGFLSPPRPSGNGESMPVPSSPGHCCGPSGAGDLVRSDRIVIGRRRAHRLDITLAKGSITEADASAYVLGLFKHVKPGGPAAAIDQLLDGAVSQLVARRMFNANVGEITVVPCGRHLIRADLIAFAGLGSFHDFTDDTLEVIGENLVRTFMLTRVADFATVPFAAGSGQLSLRALEKLMRGFLRGLRDMDGDERFRSITICETDPVRYDFIRAELFRLSTSNLFDDIEVTLRERTLPPPAVNRGLLTRRLETEPPTTYLLARMESSDNGDPELVTSVMTSGPKAAIFKDRKVLNKTAFDALLDNAANKRFDPNIRTQNSSHVKKFGVNLTKEILSPRIQQILSHVTDQPLVVVNDVQCSRIPWSTLNFSSHIPALGAGISQRFEAENLSVAKWLEQRQIGPTLDVLLVIDPTKDLNGAKEEGKKLVDMLNKFGPTIRVTTLYGTDATREAVLDKLSSGEFDVLHYAGHAGFDPRSLDKSGLLCAYDRFLTGADLASASALPALVVFNACRAGRVRGIQRTESDDWGPRVIEQQSVAEALMRGGLANFLGTYWDVGDSAAVTFAQEFYQNLLNGEALGAALLASRRKLDAENELDWANYMLYGDAGFVLKVPQRS